MNREGFHDWRKEYEEKTIVCISALCVGACGLQQEARRGGDDPGAGDDSGDDGGTYDRSPGRARDVF